MAYAIVYYYTKVSDYITHVMSRDHTHPQLEIASLISTMLYFGYTVVMVFGFWLLTGTIGFYATYIFICKIYAAVKQD